MQTVPDKLTSTILVAEPKSRALGLGGLLFKGGSALGAATLLERGLSFIANIAAARFGGAHIFGAYSVAMTTANNVASYAGAGIGTTANRFSGEYPYGSEGYGGLLRTLGMVSIASAALAGVILWFAADPLAVYLIHNPGLASLLRLAAISAGAIILLECMRGLLIGQRRFTALITLSGLFGGGLAIVLPLAAKRGPSDMVLGQSIVALSAVFICVTASRQLKFTPPTTVPSTSVKGPRAASIVKFGLVQLMGMIGLNAAGWWVASLVARTDISLVQAGWYSVAFQFRNISAMPSGLVAQTAYAQLSDSGSEGYGGAERVTLISTIVATLISLLVAGSAAAMMPWIIPRLYGTSFAPAELAATLAVATGLVHMSAAPAAARLTVVSLPLTGFINGIWSLLLVALGTWWVPRGGAAEATVCFLVAHLFAAIAVLIALYWQRSASRELVFATLPAIFTSLLLAILGWLRASGTHKAEFSGAMVLVTSATLWMTYQLGCRNSPSIRAFTITKFSSHLRDRYESYVRNASH